MNTQSFGEYIRLLRKQKGFGVTELAKLADISPSYLSQIENGKRDAPQPKILQRLADQLGVSHYDLMTIAGHFEPSAGPVVIEDEITKMLVGSLHGATKELLMLIQGLSEEQITNICVMIKTLSKKGVNHR